MVKTLKYNGERSDEIIMIRKKRPVSAPFSTSLLDLNLDVGEDWVRTKKGTLKIHVELGLRQVRGQSAIDFQREHLAQFFDTNEPVKLIFDSEPHKHYFVVPDGEIEYNDDDNIKTASITFLAHRGYADSNTSKTFRSTINSDGVTELLINNQGSVRVPITYRVKHNHENGYVGFVSQYGAAQIGDAQEVDNKVIKKSIWAIRSDTQTELLNDWTNGQGYLSSDSIAKNGTWKGYKIDYKEFVGPNSVGTGTAWHGASKFKRFADNPDGTKGSKSFTATGRLWFANGAVNQIGLMEFMLANADGSKRIGIGIHKSSTNQNVFRVKLYHSGIANAKHDVEYIHNMNEATGANKVTTYQTGIIEVKKIREKITFTFGGKSYSFSHNSLKDVVFENISLFSGSHGTSKYCTRMDWDYVFVQAHDVSVETNVDVPNAFAAGSELIIQNGIKYFYNPNNESTEAPIPIEDVKGSVWFQAPPGETKVQVYYSDFSDPPPTITAEIQEAFL